MISRLGHEEFARLDGRIRAAWVRLNQAGDTPDAHRSILCLQAAWEDVQAVAEALAAGTTPDGLIARHHHSLRRAAPDARGILESLAARAAALQREARAPAENVADARLVHAAIPVLWRLICSLRQDLRRHRPRPGLRRMLPGLARAGLLLAALAVLAKLAGFVLPWGCLVTYSGAGDPGPVRGWRAPRALMADYGTGRPLPWMRRNHWSAEWRGVLQVPEAADYAFYAQCEGGMRLWLDGELLFDNWHSAGWAAGAQHAGRTLAAGPHPLRMEFQDRGGRAAVRIRWAGGPIPPNTVIGFPHLRKY